MKTMNIDELVAIDIHTHAEKSVRMLPDEAAKEGLEARGRYFRYQPQHQTIDQMAAYYRERKMGFVCFTVDRERGQGLKNNISNEEIAESCAENADVAIPFASVDPSRGRMGVRMARDLIKNYNVKGFKFHPTVQAFFPNDSDCYPLYEVIAEHKLPAIFHTGQTGIGAGMPGGGGLMRAADIAMIYQGLLHNPSQLWSEHALIEGTQRVRMMLPDMWGVASNRTLGQFVPTGLQGPTRGLPWLAWDLS